MRAELYSSHDGGSSRSSSLQSLIRPEHPGVHDLLAASGCHADMPAFVLVRRLCTALRSWNFVDRFGPSALERVVNERAGNCIDLSAVLCAALRARHLERCYVLLGSKRDLFPAAMHAWVLAGVERPHAWVLVDPDRFEPEPRCPRTIEERLTLLAIFNDRELITGAASRADFLAAACMEGSRE